MVPPVSCFPKSTYLARYDSLWWTQQPPPHPPSYVSEEKESIPGQQPKEHLRLWTPSHNHLRVIHSSRDDKMHMITEDQLNCILEVMGASLAEKTKEAYGTGLLAYHIFCNMHGIAEHQCAPIRANTLLAFLSSCAGSYSKLFWVDTLELIHSLLDPDSHRDAAIFACLTVVFYCITRLGEFTVQSIKQFCPTKHITRAHVTHHHDLNSLPVTKFRIPWTKTSPMGEDTQCAPLGGITDPIRALERHLHMNPADPGAHLFTWKHPTSGLRPLSRSEVIKCITSLMAAHNLPSFKGHSLRIGGTLHYLLCRTPFDVVKMIWRWAGDSFTIYL
ncbi:hypothetical protein EDC04DRAFT_2871493 [Pisolithus marmoratus]|nr:hypothetical protein EDC04DRAFT_2871493 [Pisolithus marmoratus]